MKNLVIRTIAAAALATVSMTGFAADPADQQPLLLTTSQMDLVDAAGWMKRRHSVNRAFASASAEASGRRTYTDTYTRAATTEHSSNSVSESYAVTGRSGGLIILY